MVQVSEILKDRWIDRAIAQLDDEKTFGIALIEFSRTIIDRPENWAKIKNSNSGHAANFQCKLVLRELRMWCCRVWDKQGHSLRTLAPRLQEKTAEIVAARLKAHPDWPTEQIGIDSLPSQIGNFRTAIEDVSSQRLLAELRITRDEHLAHLVQGASAARKELVNAGIKSGYTYNEVMQLAERSVALIAEAISIWHFHTHTDKRTAEIMRADFEMYWRLLPNFCELEEAERISRIQV